MRRLITLWADALALPGVPTGAGRVSMLRGLGLLLLLAVCGATFVHTVEYHLGLGASGDPVVAAQAMLAQSPVRGSLLLILSFTVATIATIALELRSLTSQRRQLTTLAYRHGIVTPTMFSAPRRQPRRLVSLALCLVAMEVPLDGLIDRLWPMAGLIRMHGVPMYMAVQAPIPPLLAQLLMAMLLAWVVWLFERRFTSVRSAIATVRRLLDRLSASTVPVVVRADIPGQRPSERGSPSILSRPPPYPLAR